MPWKAGGFRIFILPKTLMFIHLRQDPVHDIRPAHCVGVVGPSVSEVRVLFSLHITGPILELQ
jgi:hypothetical protein